MSQPIAKIRILIIEDNQADAELAMREIKGSCGPAEFLTVETAEAFLASLSEFKPDIIISDYMLPDFDGMTALKMAIQQVPDVPFIILTGSMNEDTAVTCMKTGAWDYVIKEHIKRLGPAVVIAIKEKKIRQEKEQAKDEAEKAYQVKKEFLANISHELRTPLNGILGMFQILDTLDLGVDEKYWLSMAKHAADNLNRIILDLLNFIELDSRSLRIKTEPFQISELIHSILKIFEKDVEAKKLKLEYMNYCSRNTFSGDKTRIAQLAWNLISNAVKFSDSGTIQIETRAKDNNLYIIVADEGCGFDRSRINDIFLPMQQLESPYTKTHGGIGLGLAIVKSIIDLMKGEINVESTPGKGSRFEIIIPGIFSTQKLDETVTRQVNISASAKGKTILVVEDESINRLFVCSLLKKHGFTVSEARTGQEAIDLAISVPPDLILMDIGLPGINGAEASLRISKNPATANLPIIALTAHALPEEREYFLSCGMAEVITKPFGKNELFSCIEKYLAPPIKENNNNVQDK